MSNSRGETCHTSRDLFQLFDKVVVYFMRELNINNTRKAGGGLISGWAYNRMYFFVSMHRAANNSRSSDNGRSKFGNVRRNRNLGRTSLYTTLSNVPLCYVRQNFPFVQPKWCPSRTYVLSRQKNYLQPCMQVGL